LLNQQNYKQKSILKFECRQKCVFPFLSLLTCDLCMNFIFVKTSKLKLEEAIKQSEEEIQKRAGELFQLVDSISKFKEHVGSKISEMRRDLSETAAAVSVACRGDM